MMKKLLSILLAVAMMVSMVPAAYAEDEITVVEAPAGAEDAVIAEEPQAAPAEEPPAQPQGSSLEDADPLTPGAEATAVISEPGAYAYFSYTPEATDDYEFISYGEGDTYGTIYDADGNVLASDDDGGGSFQFRVCYELQAGSTYYFSARYLDSERTGSFPVKLSAYFNNHFTAVAEQETVMVKPGETATMRVIASSNAPEKISYQWYDVASDPIEGETGDSYTVENVGGHQNYYCVVEDGCGSSISVSFQLRVDSNFSAVAEQEDVFVTPGTSAQLRVITTSDSPERLTYQWRDAGWNEIAGETGDSYITPPVTGFASFVCDVEDGYGLGESVRFYVHPDTQFSAEAVQSDFTVSPNTTVTLQVNASSTEPEKITYSWYDRDSNLIEGETGSEYTTEPLNANTEYCCEVHDGYGTGYRVYFHIQINTNLSARAAESNVLVPLGESATLEVIASSDLPLSYRWRERISEGGGGVTWGDIENATTNMLVTGPVTKQKEYCCVVTDGVNDTTVWFQVSADTNFSAYALQSNVTVPAGETATLEVIASSDLPLSYRWMELKEVEESDDSGSWTYQEWVEIPDATGSSFVTPPVSGYTEYSCVVSDGCNSDTIWFCVSRDLHFEARAVQDCFWVSLGESVTLEVNASSDEPEKISYRWYDNNWNPISGETGSSFTVPPATGYTRYICEVSDGYGVIKSVYFSILIETHLRVTAEQTEFNVAVGDTVTLEVTATSDEPEKISYRWYDDSWDAIPGATGSSFTPPPATGYAHYICEVSDGYGNYQSVDFKIIIETHFSARPVRTDFTVPAGETVTLEVIATSDEPEKISYRWLQGRTESGNVFRWVTIEGATGSSFTTPPVEKSNEYRCEVSDGYGQTRSFEFSVNIDYSDQIPALAQPLLLDTDMTARISGDCEYAFYYFIPEESGEYIISSYGENDTFVHFYNADCRQLDTDDDSGEGNNFYLACDLTAGETYYYGVRFYNRERIGTIPFRFWRGNELRVTPDYQEVPVPFGETTTLTVSATAIDMSGISYQWQENIEIQGETYSYWEWVDLEGETGTSFTTPAVTGHKSYRCVVQDGLGGTAEAHFSIQIDVHFEAYQEQSDFSVAVGETVSMHVIASSDAPEKITYQWYRAYKYYDDNGSWWWSWDDDTMIEGANGDTWVSDPVEEVAAYFCRVSDGFGSSRNLRFTVGIDTHFTARQQQERIKVPAGETATLEVIASSDVPDAITYQWYRCSKYYYTESEWGWSWSNDDILVGKTGSSLTTGPINEEQAYVCQVQDGYGSQRVLWFYISVETHFTAKAEQTDIYAKLNEPATLRVIASSDYPEKISYAWYYRGRLMENETGATLVTDPVTEAKWYDCRVSDGYGSTITVHFMVHVDTNFSAKAKQNEFYIQPGESVDLEMIIQSDYPEKISVEWYKCSKVYYSDYDWSWSRELIEGAEGPTLTTGPINEWAHYEVIVWNGFGEGWGEEFDVYIDTDFKAEAVNEKVYVPYEQSAELEVAASVKAPGELSYQWYSTKIMTYMDETYWEEMTPIDGETGPTLTTGPVKEHELYLCRVEDGFGREAIIEFNVYVNTGFTAEAEEEHVYVSMGDTATLRVIAGADDGVELGYSWFRYYTVSDGIYEDEYHEWIENIGPALTVRNVGGYSHYACLVSDDFGNEKLVHFYVHIQNHFAAEAVNPVNVIGANETVELKLNVSGDDLEGLTYQWYNYRMDGMALAYYDYFKISGETGSTFVATTKYEKYRCVVKDRFGTPIAVDFTVKESGDGFTVTVDDHYVTSRGNVLAHTDLDTSLLYSGEVEFTVSSDGNKAVLVLVETGDGYTVLPCTTDADGVHHYTVNVTGDTKLVLTFRGDADLNAAVNMRDSLAIKKHSAGTAPLTGVALLAANADSNAAVNMRDGLSVKKQSAGTAMIAW